MFKFFTKEESIAVTIILLVVIFISLLNFRVALRRGRDNERENDVSDISKQLDDFQSKFGMYPLSDAPGKIKGCGVASKVENLTPCTFGKDHMQSMGNIVPADPGTYLGYSYYYISDGKNYQILASLEGRSDESVYMKSVELRNIKCGNFICNFGKANGNTPLDKSLQEYENELNAKTLKK